MTLDPRNDKRCKGQENHGRLGEGVSNFIDCQPLMCSECIFIAQISNGDFSEGSLGHSFVNLYVKVGDKDRVS